MKKTERDKMNRLTHKYLHGGYWASIFKVSACGENECKGEIIDRLAAYENAEEKGLLVQLPCKVGDTVFEPNKRGFISTYKIISVHFYNCSTLIGWTLIDGVYSDLNGFEASALGKTVFLTMEDAEKALAEMEISQGKDRLGLMRECAEENQIHE